MNRRQRFLVPIIGVLVLVLVGGSAGFLGYRLGAERQGTHAAADLGLFWEAWDLIDRKFFGENRENAEQRVEGAVAGMVNSLGDPYTVYLPPAQDELFRSDLEGRFAGIGAELEVRESRLTIVAPLSGTPAERAGLRPGDVILRIDDKPVTDMSFDNAILAIRGDVGTSVTLSLWRGGEELDVSIVRDTIVVKSVETADLAGGRAAYIKMNKFGDDTVKLLRDALNEAVSSGKQGVVLDLRNNPGGYLQGAVQAVGMLLPDSIQSDDEYLKQRTAVREMARDGKERLDRATNRAVAPDMPLVVLVNKGSASASEILAGALQDYGRAKLVGETTFGKGSVQDLADLKNGGSIKVTVAQWLTPKGAQITNKGITPDIVVALPEDVRPSVDDAQVAAALEDLGIR